MSPARLIKGTVNKYAGQCNWVIIASGLLKWPAARQFTVLQNLAHDPGEQQFGHLSPNNIFSKARPCWKTF